MHRIVFIAHWSNLKCVEWKTCNIFFQKLHNITYNRNDRLWVISTEPLHQRRLSKTTSCSSVLPLNMLCPWGSELWRTSVQRGNKTGASRGETNSQVRSMVQSAMFRSSPCKVCNVITTKTAPCLLMHVCKNLEQWGELGTRRALTRSVCILVLFK